MELVIDIPQSLYANLQKIQNGSIAAKRILECVRNGKSVMYYPQVEGITPTVVKPYNDAISRQAAIDAIQKEWYGCANFDGSGIEIADDTNRIIENLPSVTPAQKIGRWIMTSDYLTTAYGSVDYVKCSCCGEDSLEEGNYCPNCGAKME